jgi:hypothetical protein
VTTPGLSSPGQLPQCSLSLRVRSRPLPQQRANSQDFVTFSFANIDVNWALAVLTVPVAAGVEIFAVSKAIEHRCVHLGAVPRPRAAPTGLYGVALRRTAGCGHHHHRVHLHSSAPTRRCCSTARASGTAYRHRRYSHPFQELTRCPTRTLTDLAVFRRLHVLGCPSRALARSSALWECSAESIASRTRKRWCHRGFHQFRLSVANLG